MLQLRYCVLVAAVEIEMFRTCQYLPRTVGRNKHPKTTEGLLLTTTSVCSHESHAYDAAKPGNPCGPESVMLISLWTHEELPPAKYKFIAQSDGWRASAVIPCKDSRLKEGFRIHGTSLRWPEWLRNALK